MPHAASRLGCITTVVSFIASVMAAGHNSANGLLGYANGGWITTGATNEFAIIQLGGDQLHTIKGVKLATWFDSGSGKATAVKDFEVWVSTTSTASGSLFQSPGCDGSLRWPGSNPPVFLAVRYPPLTSNMFRGTTTARGKRLTLRSLTSSLKPERA